MRFGIVSCVVLACGVASAAPGNLHHQGRLLAASGDPVNGSEDLVVSLYTTPNGGSPVWSETEAVVLADGYFSVVLGDQNALNVLDFAANTYWLGVGVSGQSEMVPRSEIQAVPVALTTLDGGGTVWVEDGSDIGYTAGSVAIGAASPTSSAALEVRSTTGGLLPPRMTTAQRDAISSPADGLLIYNSNSGELQMRVMGGWVRMGVAAVASDGKFSAVSWGDGNRGGLGTGAQQDLRTPATLTTSTYEVLEVDAGGYANTPDSATCWLTTEGELWCSGRSSHVPVGSNTESLSLTRIGANHTWQDVEMGAGLVGCGITTSNEAYCWGYQQYGGIGNGVNTGSYIYNPVLVIGGLSWKSMSPGGRYDGNAHRAWLCGITTQTGTSNGYCWGRDQNGSLGNGGGGHNYATPAAGLLSGFEWKSLITRYYHVCGITVADDLYCWGDAAYGKLGNGSTTDQQSPVAIGQAYKWASVDMGEHHTCGVRTDGIGMCWGENNEGELGTGSTTERRFPVEVLGGITWQKIAVGQHHTCGIDVAGTAYCWGRNDEGQLGDGTNTDRHVPTPVYTNHSFVDIDAGNRHTTAVAR